MLLTELHPRWYTEGKDGPRVGFTFRCPHCQSERLGVAVHANGTARLKRRSILAETPGDQPNVWEMSGSDFTSLTLTPSIDASGSGHWHGFIVDGEIQ